ncbi:MAG: leucyl/phenylalanyl-tRNA--protein transferase [Bacteroidales bacterium]|nr:leucyl/phenylalanyl-tRNA--protein transferase [Bacteroidales bacterium]
MPVYQLIKEIIFPLPEYAETNGLLAIGGDLCSERLLLAYSNGIFPWYSKDEPILWWSPDPRLVLLPENFKVSKSLRLLIKKNLFTVKFDTNFFEVIKKCADVVRTGQDDTWITNEMIDAYTNLHNLGFAHSVETYYNDKLVGGLYGISIGKAFFGESMYHTTTDASKVALFFLVEKLKKWNFDFIDAQMKTSHLISLGAKEISRKEYLELLKNSLKSKTKKGKWELL